MSARLRTRLASGLLLAVPVLVWVTTRPALGSAAGLRQAGVLLALLGFTAFTQNLVLVARVGAIERFCGGLDSLYLFHRRLAAGTVGLLVLHAGLITASLVASGSADGDALKVAAGAVALAGLGAGIAASFYARVRHETFIRIQRGLGVVFVVAVVHAVVIRPPANAAVRVYLTALAVVGVSAFAYRSVAGRITVPRCGYRVEEVRRMDDEVAEIVLQPTGEPLSFTAGQFAFLSIVGGSVSREPHPYSIASAPDDRRLRFMVKALGDYTTGLQHLEPGCEALVEGPYGTFWSRGSDNSHQVWIAGGVGIAPFLSMARALDVGRQAVDLYYCTEGPEHAHFIEDLFEIADRNPKLRVVPVRKRSLGRITADDIEGASRDIASKDIFICGPPVMMQNLADQFVAMGAQASRIHFEDFSFM